MEKMDIFWRIVELVIAVVGASVLTRIFTIRERVRHVSRIDNNSWSPEAYPAGWELHP